MAFEKCNRTPLVEKLCRCMSARQSVPARQIVALKRELEVSRVNNTSGEESRVAFEDMLGSLYLRSFSVRLWGLCNYVSGNRVYRDLARDQRV